MAITVEAYSGSNTVQTTEWSLGMDAAGPGALTAPGVYQAFLDLATLAAGDVFEFRCYEKVRTGSTQRSVYSARFANAQACPNWASPTMILGAGWDMTLKKISGTDRTVTWRISKVS
jgi:hypothetical protein